MEVFDLAGNERFKFAEAGFDETGLAAPALHGFLGLQAVAGDAEDDAFFARDAAALDQLLRARDGDAAGGLGKDAGRLGEKAYACDDLVVGHVFGMAAGFLHRADRVVAIGRRADGEGLDDGLRLGHGLDDVRALLHGVANGRAAGGLRAMDGERLLLQNAGLDELLVGLVDLREQRAAGHGHDRVPRERQPSCSAISKPMLFEPSA